MSGMKMKMRRGTLLASLLLAGTLGVGLATVAQGQATAQTTAAAQETFSTPEKALAALAKAAESKDRAALAGLFGPDYKQLLSGDRVEDDRALSNFSIALGQSSKLQKAAEDKYTVLVGKDNWPMPIPIIQRGGQWLFDTEAGLNEILNRRIGENELSAITTCRAYVVAQWEYFTEGDHDNDGVAEYAQKFMSSPGQHDGLYWEAGQGEPPSPLGGLVAEARAEGYGPRARAQRPAANRTKNAGAADQIPRRPYHGYFFKILTRQGRHAPGGQYNYIINGNMIAGYALVAYPAKWGNSGVMTFIVNQQGRVYQKNLGPNTAAIAGGMTEYDPDQSWQLVANF
jgi:Protein of unknown function (DUF2950)